MSEMGARDFQAEMNAKIDELLDLIETSAAAGVDIDPLQTILMRLQSRGQGLDLSQADPMTRMFLGGMLG